MAANIKFRAGERLFDERGQLTVDAAARLNALAALADGAVAKDVGTADWTAATGTATRATFVTGTVTLPQLAERVKAMLDDLLASAALK